jgi:hypothetical protein
MYVRCLVLLRNISTNFHHPLFILLFLAVRHLCCVCSNVVTYRCNLCYFDNREDIEWFSYDSMVFIRNIRCSCYIAGISNHCQWKICGVEIILYFRLISLCSFSKILYMSMRYEQGFQLIWIPFLSKRLL